MDEIREERSEDRLFQIMCQKIYHSRFGGRGIFKSQIYHFVLKKAETNNENNQITARETSEAQGALERVEVSQVNSGIHGIQK